MGECWWRMGREETNRRQTIILLQTFAFTIYYVKIRKKYPKSLVYSIIRPKFANT